MDKHKKPLCKEALFRWCVSGVSDSSKTCLCPLLPRPCSPVADGRSIPLSKHWRKRPSPPQEFMQIGKRRRDTPPPNHPFLSPFGEYGSISCCNAIVSDRDIGLNPKTYPQKIFSSRNEKESIWIKSSALSSSWVCAQDFFAALLSNLLRKAGSSPPPPVLGFLPLFLLFSASSPSPLYSVVPTKGNDGKRTKFAKPAYFFAGAPFL